MDNTIIKTKTVQRCLMCKKRPINKGNGRPNFSGMCYACLHLYEKKGWKNTL